MIELTHILGLTHAERAAALASEFPGDGSVPGIDADAAATLWAEGGRAAALARLATIDPLAYARTRNHVGGDVTRLSPWLRHGVLSLAEVRDAALARVRRPEDAAKLISELGWRDYWQQVYAAVGNRIRQPLETPAQPSRMPPVARVPQDVLAAQTGLQCVDAFVRKLHGTGWLHNHERMWLASWLVHVRGVQWQAGADWFLSHLLDGDPASNHLSWQWVAGTFSAKPYLFNRENLETFTSGVHCQPCGLRANCPLDSSYEALGARCFATDAPTPREPLRIRPQPSSAPGKAAAIHTPLVWLTLDSAGVTTPAVLAYPQSPRLFVIDPAWLAEERPSLNRLVFLFACLADVPGVEVLLGDPVAILPARARAHGCDGLALAETPCPRIRRAAAAIQEKETGTPSPLPMMFLPWPSFCDRSSVKDFGRFSRYWRQVESSAMKPTAAA
jgi:deoxyribodipyrimidine photo-lyase